MCSIWQQNTQLHDRAGRYGTYQRDPMRYLPQFSVGSVLSRRAPAPSVVAGQDGPAVRNSRAHLQCAAVPASATCIHSRRKTTAHQSRQNIRRGLICRSGKQQQQPQPSTAGDQGDMDDVIMIGEEDDEDFEFEDDFEDEFEDGLDEDGFLEDEDEEAAAAWLEVGSDEDPGPEVLTGNVTWGDQALKVAEEVLQRPENLQLSLYLFRVQVPSRTIEVRLDRQDDVYGSPDIDDIERFSRALLQGLEAELGVEEAEDISVEVSSPGAERTLIIPQDLLRFKELPMRVEFRNEVGQLATLILQFVDMDESEGVTNWELADVKANQNVKGRGLSKKQRAQRYSIRLSDLERVRIFIDF